MNGHVHYDARCTCPIWGEDAACPVGNEAGRHPRSAVEAGEAVEVLAFRGKFFFLSNFYAAPAAYDGVLYPTSEHAFQAAKTALLTERDRIQRAPTPGKAKQLGRAVQLRADWHEVRVAIMWGVVLNKFLRTPELGRGLMLTGRARLVEGNTHGDRFWGACQDRHGQWKGENMLGRLLTSLRRRLGTIGGRHGA